MKMNNAMTVKDDQRLVCNTVYQVLIHVVIIHL